MSDYGKNLSELHLLQSAELESPIAKYQGQGDNKVQQLKFDRQERRIYINRNQYFEGIEKDAWEYHIGGYQICDKWLKDRKGRILTLTNIKSYCKIITAIKTTITVQKEIDGFYPEIEKEIIAL